MQPPSDSPKCTNSSAKAAAGALVLSFIKAKKDLQLYPAGNAAVIASLQKMLQLLKDNYSSDDVVEMLVEKEKICVNGIDPGLDDVRAKDLARNLFRRGTRKILLDPGIPQDEMQILIGLLNLSREAIAARGGIEKLTKQHNIIHAAVEETAELVILDGESFSVPREILAELYDNESDDTPLETAASLGSMFVRIQDADSDTLKRLQFLLKKPDHFAHLVEKFALQLEQTEKEAANPAQRVESLLNVLRTVGTAAGKLPSEEERRDLLQNLALSVLDLSAGLRTDLINQGLLPNLSIKSIESEILSRFPVSELADVLLQNFEVSGATSSIMQGYLQNLNISGSERTALVDTLKKELDETGILTAELETALGRQSGNPEMLVAENIELSEVLSPQLEYYPSERVLFSGAERNDLVRDVARELAEPVAQVMAPALLELMRYDKSCDQHPLILEKATACMEYFLDVQDYDRATSLLRGVQEEYAQKKSAFSPDQLEPLRTFLDEFCGEQRIQELAARLKNMNVEGPDYERLMKYFGAVGSPVISSLMLSLEEEQSRHARLLICKAVAQAGDKNILAIAEKLKHPKWYVVRNAISILGQTGSPAAVPFLRPLLEHQDGRVRKEVLKALASIRSGEAVDLLCLAAANEDASLRKAALGWVAAIEAEQAMPILYRLLSPQSILRQEDEVLRLAVEALRAIATEPAIELLEKLSHTHSLFRRTKAATIRKLSLRALEEVASEREHA